jgi:putative CocE/NonD family hydrolase
MGPFDQIQIATLPGHNMVGLPVAARRDVVVFQTPPLICDLMVAGEICAVLYVSSDAPDTDFFVKLIDVYPPTDDYPAGYAFPVTDGILRARYREGFESATMMSPGEVYKLTIPVQPAGNVFKAGHRLRLDIASSSFPNFDINQNSGDPENRVWRIAQNTIHHDSVRASRIELPIVTGPTLSAN